MPSYQELALDLATHATSLRLRVNGISMSPLLQTGDYVIVEPVLASALRVGDVIAFRYNRDTITHRIVSRTPQGFLTLGDNFRKLDPLVVPEMILGRVSAVEKNGRPRSLKTWPWPVMQQILAWLGWQTAYPNRAKWVALFPWLLFSFTRHLANLLFLL